MENQAQVSAAATRDCRCGRPEQGYACDRRDGRAELHQQPGGEEARGSSKTTIPMITPVMAVTMSMTGRLAE